MTSAILHPSLFALLLTLAAIGAPLACSAGMVTFSGARISQCEIQAGQSARANSAQVQLRFARAESHARTTPTTHCAHACTWVTRATFAGLAAVPPPSL